MNKVSTKPGSLCRCFILKTLPADTQLPLNFQVQVIDASGAVRWEDYCRLTVWQVEEEVEPCVLWPPKGQPISFDQFTVTQRSQSHVCLSNEDELVVHTYTLESAQVIPSSALLREKSPPPPTIRPLRSSAHGCSSDSYVSGSVQDDYVLEVTHYSTLCWPNPDSPISQTFELINLVKEENSHKDGPVVVHDE